MSKQIYFEDVDVGDELPTLRVTLAAGQVTHYAVTAGMPGPRFMSDEAARAEGLPGQIVPGNLSMALFSRLLTGWCAEATLIRLSCTFRGLVHPHQPLTLHGVITERHASDHGNFIQCDLILENEEGERRVTGTATLLLPSRE